MRELEIHQMKQSDFYQSLNSGNGIDNFLLSIKYYRAELSTLCDQLGAMMVSEPKNTDDLQAMMGNFKKYFEQFVYKFNISGLKTAAKGIEENHEIQNILEKVQERLQAVSHRNSLNSPTTFPSLQLAFAMMKSVELTQIDILLWGLMTISMNIKERLHRKNANGDNIVKVADRIDMVLHEEKDLSHARDIIEGWQIELYGQGIFDMNQELIETEILMRVKDRHGKMTNPEDFLKFVKKAGYIEKLDWMILSLSFMFISNKEIEWPFSVNVNLNTIQDEQFIQKIKTLAQINNIDPKKVIIEFLEYESSINVVHTNQVIRELRAFGFKIAIDDFPSGYNTLWDISKFLDIDIIKIDGPHVMEIFKVCSGCHAVRECMSSLETSFGQEQRCIRKLDMLYDLETLIFSLKFLKLQSPNVVFFAERVEDESVFNFLKQLDLIAGYQGYFFEKPKYLFEGGKEENKDRIEESSLAISFSTSSIKVMKSSKEVQPEVKKEFIQIYIQQLEEYTDGLLELNDNFSIDEFMSNQCNETIRNMLAKIILFLGGDSLNFYILDSEKKNFHIRNITTNGVSMNTEMPIVIDEINRVKKENVNLYTLLQNTPDSVKSGFQIAATAVPGVGDDIVVKINDYFFLGLDDSEIAMDYSKSIQINFLLLFAMIIRNKLEAKESLK